MDVCQMFERNSKTKITLKRNVIVLLTLTSLFRKVTKTCTFTRLICIEAAFLSHPADIYLHEGLQDIDGCTLPSWGHTTLHPDSHMAAHSPHRRSQARILHWDIGTYTTEEGGETMQDPSRQTGYYDVCYDSVITVGWSLRALTATP